MFDQEEISNQKYCVGIDKLKFFLVPFACINALGLYLIPEGYYVQVVSGFVAPCFYIISGFLVLSRDKERRQAKILRGMKRALFLFLVMLILYVPANILYCSLQGIPWLQIISNYEKVFEFVLLCRWPFPIGETIWFIQALLYAYLFLFLINGLFERVFIRRVLLIASIPFMLITTEFAGALDIHFFGMEVLPAGMLTRALPYLLIGGLLREKVEKLFSVVPLIYPIFSVLFLVLSLGEFSLQAMYGVFVDDSHCISLGLAAIAIACWAIVTPEAEEDDFFSVNGKPFSKWIYVAFPLVQLGINLLALYVAPSYLGDLYEPDGLIVYLICLMAGICAGFLNYRFTQGKEKMTEDEKKELETVEENKAQNWDNLEVIEFRICLASKKIGITAMYEEVRDMCQDYLVENEEKLEDGGEDAYVSLEDDLESQASEEIKNESGTEESLEDFHVTISQEDIEFEREKSIREAKAEGNEPIEYPDSYLETLAVYRKIAIEMLAYDTWLMHGAAVGVKGEAVLFAAPSGVGKTTHLKLWLDNIPDSFVVNGDKPLMQWDGDVCMVCGTPWAGKEGMQKNVSLPLRAICFLERGEANRMEKVSFADAYPLLLQQSYRSLDASAMEKTLELLRRVCMTIPMYRLYCTMDAEAAQIAYEGIYGERP